MSTETPIWDLPRPEQWDRHRERNPGHTATLRIHGDARDGIHCNTCLWHTYEAAEVALIHARRSAPSPVDHHQPAARAAEEER